MMRLMVALSGSVPGGTLAQNPGETPETSPDCRCSDKIRREHRFDRSFDVLW